ncbi:MAG TPA: methyltransferase domain-containing protein [Acidimicrobiales bacterium]|nr:methyltransferase domain-containing protein [Acidimicrobiales bacterium]
MRLDLGCGRQPREGYEGVDVRYLGQRWLADLNQTPWVLYDNSPDGVVHLEAPDSVMALEDSSVEAVYCSHFVEHVYDLIGFMDELWRVCANEAEVVIRHPYAWSSKAWQDPTHVRALVEGSWSYYNLGWRIQEGLDHYPITADFEVVNMDMVLNPELAHLYGENPVALAKAARGAVNVIDELVVTMVARK